LANSQERNEAWLAKSLTNRLHIIGSNPILTARNLFGIPNLFPYIYTIMKEQDKFNGLNKRHVSQIIRRNMITKTKPSKKGYNRKKERKGLDF